MPSHSSATVAALIVTVITLAHAAATPMDEPIRVADPKNGDVINSGGALTVTVTAPPGAFKTVSIAGNGPFELSTGLNKPPYQFSYLLPGDLATGRYRFRATGATASGETVCSDLVEIDIERADEAKKLQTDFVSLTFTDEQELRLQIWGIFGDGTKVDLTRSRRIGYITDKPSIATVSEEGVVTAAAAGKARITIKYGDKTLVVPVTVNQNRKK